MSPERWGQVKVVFTEAMSLPVAERSVFVARACESDVELARDVEALIAAAGVESVPPIPPATVAKALGKFGVEAPTSDAATQSLLASALGTEYEIIRPVGRGGMGEVYLARDLTLGLDVAVKVLRPDLAATAPAARARFRQEAKIIASLTHPGIIRLYKYGEACGIWYFVMGYVGSTTLADRLRRDDPVPAEEVRRVLFDLADALEHAHRRHVIHRDIKSSNILLDDGDVMRPMLADFGISKIQGASDTLTPSRTVIGTPAYMSPEQLVGDPDIDERSDIFSLGLVGYAMLVGHEPFVGIADVGTWRLTHDPEPLSKVAPLVPVELAAVITRCLARDRTQRFPDAASLKEALMRADKEWIKHHPEVYRPLAGYGQYALAWAIVFTALALVPNHSSPDTALLLLLHAILVPLGFVLHVWNIGRSGMSNRELIHIACWPPEWWGMWWPRALRRPEDQWARLPRPARLVRATLSLYFVVLPALILLETRGGAASSLLNVVKYTLLSVTAAVTAGALWWARGKNLRLADAVRVLVGPTMPSPAWNRNEDVRRLLAPVGALPPPNPSNPTDWLRAIEDFIRRIPPSFAALGDVTIKARGLHRAIASCDADMARLGQESSDAEVDRLEKRVDELVEQVSLHGDRKSGELLNLVRSELAIVRAIRADRQLTAKRRADLFQLLRVMWTQLGQLYERSIGGVAVGPDPTQALASLCAEIDDALRKPGTYEDRADAEPDAR